MYTRVPSSEIAGEEVTGFPVVYVHAREHTSPERSRAYTLKSVEE